MAEERYCATYSQSSRDVLEKNKSEEELTWRRIVLKNSQGSGLYDTNSGGSRGVSAWVLLRSSTAPPPILEPNTSNSRGLCCKPLENHLILEFLFAQLCAGLPLLLRLCPLGESQSLRISTLELGSAYLPERFSGEGATGIAETDCQRHFEVY